MKKTTKNNKPSGDDVLPGYPKYPATEDIVYQEKRLSMDADGTVINDVPDSVPASPAKAKKVKHSESDVTKEDLKALRSEENTFKGDDKELEDRVYPVDFAGDDLDVPGADLDDSAEQDGAEDEENNSYSLGGDNHEDLDEDRSAL